ncbi:unnamed protein product [Euphydryas editha]|uniref:Uncharacterized protein n=1 Tax=Euphydryas editha TaxID=104508 RepID=A0AAU9TBC1_EUPED|nr:unnamed protein product [Euphydryas editha]
MPLIPKRREEVLVTEVAIQNTVPPAKTLPVLPFITELPSCPDVSFDEILISPLGCLDPILNVYGTSMMPVTELPVSKRPLSPETTSAQYRQESLSPQTTKIQRNQQFNQPTGISSLDYLSPYSQIPRPRYEIKKIKQKPSRISKRQYLAEVFKRSAINQLMAAAKSVNEPALLSNKMAYQNNGANDIKKWRL